jgi:signal transduction histidine kinase
LGLSGVFGPGTSGLASRILLVGAAICWPIAAALFATLNGGSAGRVAAATAVYGTAAAFAVVATAAAARRSGKVGRPIWTALAGALVFRLLGDAGWSSHRLLGAGESALLLHDVAYVTSYLFFLAALLWLVASTTHGIALVVALDALSIMLSVGILAWYFGLGPVAAEVGGLESRREILMSLSGTVCDAGFLFLCLVVLSTSRRPPFTSLLAAAFASFLIADALYLRMRYSGPYELGNWPELFWASGFILIGLGALWAIYSGSFARDFEIQPWRVFSFWIGPLSPAVHYAFLLAWGASGHPLPPYVLWGGAAIVAYLALRISLLAYVSRRLRLEAQRLAVQGEQGRISEDLHDTLKRSVYRAYLLLSTYHRTRHDDDPDAAREILDRAVDAAREANYQVSRPIEELRVSCEAPGLGPAVLLRQTLSEVEACFGINPHEDLRAPLSELHPGELAAAYRIASEALWNAAKHSKATNIWLESRKIGSVFLIKVRDDGHGFRAEDPHAGLGLSLMKARAREAGGTLEVISKPRGGTSVLLWFDKK